MFSYQEMRSANLEENRRMLQELGVKIPSAGERLVFNKPKISTKRSKQSKVKEPPPEPETHEKQTDENDQSGLRSSFRVRLKTKNYYEDVWEAPRTKVPRVRPDNSYGSIEDIEVGQEWATRMECSYDLVHRPTVAGIHGGPEGAYSVALSGGYEDDIDLGDSFTYTGEGGRDLKGSAANPKNLRTAPQSKDQTLERGNLALSISVETQNPVRVIRGYKLTSPYAPEEGYRYDGLYHVKKFWVARGKSGFKVFKFAFVRCDPDPSPWIKVPAENGLTAKSPTSPTTPTAAVKKNLEACEAPSLETSESEDLTHLGAASKGAAQPEERATVKKRVSFHSEDSVRLFETEDRDEDSDEEMNVSGRVSTRQSSRIQTAGSGNAKSGKSTISHNDTRSGRRASKVPGEDFSKDDEKSDETVEPSPKTGKRTQNLRNSSRFDLSEVSPKNRSQKQSDGGKGEISPKVSKKKVLNISKTDGDNSSPNPPISQSKSKSPKSTPNGSPHLPGYAADTKHDSEAAEDEPISVIRKSKRPPKPTEKIKSPENCLWMKKSSKRSGDDGFVTDAPKSKNSPKPNEEATSAENTPKKLSELSAGRKSSSETPTARLSSKLSPEETSSDDSPKLRSAMVAGKRSSDDSPKPRKSPKLSAEEMLDTSLKSKKSPQVSAGKKSSDNSPMPRKSPKLSAEMSDTSLKSKKSPQVSTGKKSSDNSPVPGKSPKLSAEMSDTSLKSKKSPQISGGRRSSDPSPIPTKSRKLGAQKESPGNTSRYIKSPKLTAEKKPSDDFPKFKKSPKVGTENKLDGTLKKSPKSRAEKKASDDTAKSPRGRPPKWKKLSDDSPKSQKTVQKKSSDDSPFKKSPKLKSPNEHVTPQKSPKSEKQQSQGNTSPTLTVPVKRGRGRPPTHGRYSQKNSPVPASDAKKTPKSKESSPSYAAKSPNSASKLKKSPRIVNPEKGPQKDLKKPNKIPNKSPTQGKLSNKKLSPQADSGSSETPGNHSKKLSDETRKLVTKKSKSASVEKAASILSKAKASKLPASSFKKKLAKIASARAKALKIEGKSSKKVKKSSDHVISAASSPKDKQKTKSPQKADKPAHEKYARRTQKRPAPSPGVDSPRSEPSPGKKPRKESPDTSANLKRPALKKSRISEYSESVINDTAASLETDDPPTLQRYDEEEMPTPTLKSPKRKTAVTNGPARKKSRDESPSREVSLSPEREVSDSSVPSSPCWTPVSPSSPVKSSPKTQSSPKTKISTVKKSLEDFFSDEEILAMMKFSLCPCSGESNSKVTIKMVDGRWIEVREPEENTPTGNEITDSNSGVKTGNEYAESSMNTSFISTADTIDAAKSSR